MKRCWIGAALLGLILVLGLLSGAFLGNFCEEMAAELTQAAREENSQGQIRAARDRWEGHKNLLSILCDHAALEEIGEEFQLLDPGREDFRQSCLGLAIKLETLGQAQTLTWANVF